MPGASKKTLQSMLTGELKPGQGVRPDLRLVSLADGAKALPGFSTAAGWSVGDRLLRWRPIGTAVTEAACKTLATQRMLLEDGLARRAEWQSDWREPLSRLPEGKNRSPGDCAASDRQGVRCTSTGRGADFTELPSAQ